MKILITGADGFLGRHTSTHLQHKGHEVVSFTQDVRTHLPFERFDAVFHFAAFVGGRKGIDNNSWLIAQNIELDRVVFQWAEQFCKKIIYPSSCAAYPLRLQQTPNTFMQEDDFGEKTFDLYGLSKVVAETLLQKLSIPAHVVRPFSVYGSGQSLDYPLPDIIRRAREGRCSVWGTGQQTRDWVYIDDVVNAFETLLHIKEPVTVNLGTGRGLSFKEVAEIVYEEIHGTRVPVEMLSDEPEGASHRVADTTRQICLGLPCNTPFEEGIRKILNEEQNLPFIPRSL